MPSNFTSIKLPPLISTYLLIILFHTGCFSTSQPSQNEQINQEPPKPINEQPLTAAPGVHWTAVIKRPRAQIRLGPGLEFPIREDILEQGDQVVIFDQLGKWSLIMTPQNHQRGWLHAQYLAKAKINDTPITWPSNSLPTVVALTKIRKAHSFPDWKPISVAIKKGEVLLCLRRSKKAVLLVLNDKSKAYVWVSQKLVN